MPAFNFAPFPTLTTKNYLLRRLAETDAPSIFILRTDEEVNRYIYRKKASSIDDALSFIKMIDENILKNDSILWAICRPGDASLMGSICLWNFDNDKTKADIGYEMLPVFQGLGVFKEVMPAVINFAFDNLGLKTIEACVHPGNTKSIKLLKANGFVTTGEVDENGELCYVLRAFMFRKQ